MEYLVIFFVSEIPIDWQYFDQRCHLSIEKKPNKRKDIAVEENLEQLVSVAEQKWYS